MLKEVLDTFRKKVSEYGPTFLTTFDEQVAKDEALQH